MAITNEYGFEVLQSMRNECGGVDEISRQWFKSDGRELLFLSLIFLCTGETTLNAGFILRSGQKLTKTPSIVIVSIGGFII